MIDPIRAALNGPDPLDAARARVAAEFERAAHAAPRDTARAVDQMLRRVINPEPHREMTRGEAILAALDQKEG